MFLVSNDSYDAVAFSMNFKVSGLKNRHGSLIKFGDDYVYIQIEYVSAENYYKLTWNSFGVNAKVFGVKHGTASTDVADGTKVTFTRQGFETLTTTVQNGRIKLDTIPRGKWTLTADGYVAVPVTILKDTEYTEDITVQYALFSDYLKNAGWNDYADLSGQNQGVIVQESDHVPVILLGLPGQLLTSPKLFQVSL